MAALRDMGSIVDSLEAIRDAAEEAANVLKTTFPEYANPEQFPALSAERKKANKILEVLHILDRPIHYIPMWILNQANVPLIGGRRKSRKNRRLPRAARKGDAHIAIRPAGLDPRTFRPAGTVPPSAAHWEGFNLIFVRSTKIRFLKA